MMYANVCIRMTAVHACVITHDVVLVLPPCARVVMATIVH